MTSLKSQAVLIGTSLLLSATLFAQSPWGRNGRYDDRYRDDRNGRYGDDRYRRGGGYGRNGIGLVDRVISHLDGTRSYGHNDDHELKHYEKARNDLYRFRDNWSRGKFDKGRLNSAIEHIDHIVDSRQVHPRERQILARDLSDLRSFRSGGDDRYRSW